MKKILLFAAVLMTSATIFAQEAQTEQPKLWKWSGVIGLNANGTGMVNWAAGGNNNVAGNVFGKLNCNYDKDALSWEAKLDADYGLTYVDQQNDKLQKTSDHLNFDTKFGWAFQPKWYLTVNAGFHTQFDLGRKYEGLNDKNKIISNILAPSYTDISVGFDYKPVEFFSLYMSPVSGRITTAYVSDNLNKKYAELLPEYAITKEHDGLRQTLQEAYGTWYYDKENNKIYRNYRAELGLNIKASLNYKYKDLTLMSNLTVFTPYAWDKVKMYHYVAEGIDGNFTEEQMKNAKYDVNKADFIGYRDNGRRFGNFDVDWDVTLSYQFLKCLNITFFTNLKYVNGQKIDKVYDKGLETEHVIAAERVQFLSNLGIGVGYSF